MNDHKKTKNQLIEELEELRQKMAQLKPSDAEEALRESENKFRDLSEKSLVGVYLIQDWIFKYANPRLAEIFGYTVEEVMGGITPEDVVLPEDWPMVRDNIRRRIEGETTSIHFTFRLITTGTGNKVCGGLRFADHLSG